MSIIQEHYVHMESRRWFSEEGFHHDVINGNRLFDVFHNMPHVQYQKGDLIIYKYKSFVEGDASIWTKKFRITYVLHAPEILKNDAIIVGLQLMTISSAQPE